MKMKPASIFLLLSRLKSEKTATLIAANMKIKTKPNMAKKPAKKAPKKGKKAPRDGNHPNALGLKGPGVEIMSIPELDEALKEYEKIMRARVALTAKEVPAKQGVVALMEKNAEKLRNPKTGNLTYHIDDKRYVEIEPAKVKIKFKADKPARKPKGSGKVEDTSKLEPEQQAAIDAGENQD